MHFACFQKNKGVVVVQLCNINKVVPSRHIFLSNGLNHVYGRETQQDVWSGCRTKNRKSVHEKADYWYYGQ